MLLFLEGFLVLLMLPNLEIKRERERDKRGRDFSRSAKTVTKATNTRGYTNVI